MGTPKAQQAASGDGWDLDRLNQGEEFAWSAFLKEFDHLVTSVPAWNKWHFSHEVQADVSQKIRSELQRALAGFKGDSSLEYFVKRICIRRCIDQVRVQARENERFVPTIFRQESGDWDEIDILAPEADDPVATVLRTERGRQLKQLVADLEDFCSEVIRRFYLEEQKYQEIADDLGVSINTVSSRLSRCMAKLRERVLNSPYFGEESR